MGASKDRINKLGFNREFGTVANKMNDTHKRLPPGGGSRRRAGGGECVCDIDLITILQS